MMKSIPIIREKGAFTNIFSSIIKEKKVAVITTEGFIRRGLFKNFNAGDLIYVSIKSNPELNDLEQKLNFLRDIKPTLLIAVGGGSVIDSAKIFSSLLGCENKISIKEALHLGNLNNNLSCLPTIVFPTTSGTGAEVTPFATIWDSQNKKKLSLANLDYTVTQVVLDPLLTTSAPYGLTLECALDTISHCLESLWNVNRTDETKQLALTSLQIVNKVLPLLLNNLHNPEFRAEMQTSSLNAGLAIAKTRTALAHSISYPLTLNFGISHGLACSLSLISLFELVEEQNPLWLGSKEKLIVLDTIELLKSFNLASLIRNHCSLKDALHLQDKMFTPQRAGNFIISDPVNLENILTKSFNS